MDPKTENDQTAPASTLSKSAQKKLLRKQRQESRKAERKALEKQQKRENLERRRKEWDEKLAAATEEERERILAERAETRKERMGKRNEERELKLTRLSRAKEIGQGVVVDLEFADLMTESEMHSLVQQIMYCYAVNGRCATPAHLWLTGCTGSMETHLQRIPGIDNWIIEKESKSYIEALQDQKDKLVYLTADAETELDELDQKKIYIIGGLVDRNRWKGITMKKANEQGIQTARLPIGTYLKMSSSQVLTVNQVMEILLKFLETKNWKDAFFQVIPQRKRGGDEAEAEMEEAEEAADEVKTNGDELEVRASNEDTDEGNNVNGITKKPRIEETEAISS